VDDSKEGYTPQYRLELRQLQGSGGEDVRADEMEERGDEDEEGEGEEGEEEKEDNVKSAEEEAKVQQGVVASSRQQQKGPKAIVFQAKAKTALSEVRHIICIWYIVSLLVLKGISGQDPAWALHRKVLLLWSAVRSSGVVDMQRHIRPVLV
jgi:hypothetical protein